MMRIEFLEAFSTVDLVPLVTLSCLNVAWSVQASLMAS